jgi:hypothetical protein
MHNEFFGFHVHFASACKVSNYQLALSGNYTLHMSEQDEINLRHAQRDWQAKQNFSGTMTMALCAAAIGGFFYYISAPSSQSATILFVLLAVLLTSCVRMLSCAAKVVEVRTTLQPVRAQLEIIDVEVVESPRHQEYRRLPRYL